ncbi:uncharacterized protein LOC124537748 [Vanessa cardui]|uniref:uncharacterized protein LOC124537748 n=1 Tax=Vanessa cardui TaxID=171605 RepID=UPI001F12AEBD|nr:uncharacterized protein LOC124537748 [Vanessa cardui]
MFLAVPAIMLFILECVADDYYYTPYNVTRPTLSGIAAYRSSLTLDWLAAEDSRQRELAAAFETELAPSKVVNTECIAYPRPAPGKIGKLMLELLKNLEGDDGILIPELIQVLIRAKLLVDTSIFESEPDFDSLVKTPGVMMGEPHATFPRVLSIIWILVTDAATTRKFGWCPVKKVNQYLSVSKPSETAKQMRALEIVVARARFVMEEFIQSITPVNIYQKKMTRPTYQKKTTRKAKPQQNVPATMKHAMKPRAHEKVPLPYQLAVSQSTSQEFSDFSFDNNDRKHEPVTNNSLRLHTKLIFFIFVFFI